MQCLLISFTDIECAAEKVRLRYRRPRELIVRRHKHAMILRYCDTVQADAGSWEKIGPGVNNRTNS